MTIDFFDNVVSFVLLSMLQLSCRPSPFCAALYENRSDSARFSFTTWDERTERLCCHGSQQLPCRRCHYAGQGQHRVIFRLHWSQSLIYLMAT